jgi:hypothetical protein
MMPTKLDEQAPSGKRTPLLMFPPGSRRSVAAAHATKIEGIGGGISHLIERAIDGHQPQAEAKGPSGLLSGHQLADALKQVAHDRGPQLPPTIHQRRSRRQPQRRVRPQPAQPSHQVG